MLKALLQARMGSERLPGKTLMDVEGKCVLEYGLDRLKLCETLDDTIVLTSDEKQDDPIADYCKQNHVECFRGDHLNVAKRYRDALLHYELDDVIRMTGDSPLLDPKHVDEMIRFYKEHDYQVVCNTRVRTYPKGQSLDMVDRKTYLETYERMAANDIWREHVTTFYNHNHTEFKFYDYKTDRPNYSHLSLCVDTPEDFENFKKFMAKYKKKHMDMDWLEITIAYHELEDEA